MVAVRDPSRPRGVGPGTRVVGGPREVLDDPSLPVVVELVGGTGVAYEVVRGALERGKHVITANKALLAAHGEELFALARAKGVELLFEASVCGGIPIVKVLRESLLGNRIGRILGIVNGTTNYILTRMGEEGLGYAEALAEAQQKGFAEADPAADVGGGGRGAEDLHPRQPRLRHVGGLAGGALRGHHAGLPAGHRLRALGGVRVQARRLGDPGRGHGRS